MRRPALLRLAPAVTISLALSCTTPTGVCGCPPGRTHAVVHGTVRTSAGVPVQGAVVNVTLYREQCGQGHGEVGDQSGRPAQSDAAGAYEARFHSFSGPSAACLRVSATRGQGASADSAVAPGVVAQLRPDDDEPARVRVDVVFPQS
jgi:hypothetical protein